MNIWAVRHEYTSEIKFFGDVRLAEDFIDYEQSYRNNTWEIVDSFILNKS
jgi:hypothetical protein